MTIQGFGGGPIPNGEASVFLQYKGSNVCLDFICGDCGETGHFDGDFTYNLLCPGCGRVYAMPSDLRLTLVSPEDPKYEHKMKFAKVPVPDEDDGL